MESQIGTQVHYHTKRPAYQLQDWPGRMGCVDRRKLGECSVGPICVRPLELQLSDSDAVFARHRIE